MPTSINRHASPQIPLIFRHFYFLGRHPSRCNLLKDAKSSVLISRFDQKIVPSLQGDCSELHWIQLCPNRLKGENNVATGNAHRFESVDTSSLKDLHKLQRVCGNLFSGFKGWTHFRWALPIFGGWKPPLLGLRPFTFRDKIDCLRLGLPS